jgi:hypothetical protein
LVVAHFDREKIFGPPPPRRPRQPKPPAPAYDGLDSSAWGTEEKERAMELTELSKQKFKSYAAALWEAAQNANPSDPEWATTLSRFDKDLNNLISEALAPMSTAPPKTDKPKQTKPSLTKPIQKPRRKYEERNELEIRATAIQQFQAAFSNKHTNNIHLSEFFYKYIDPWLHTIPESPDLVHPRDYATGAYTNPNRSRPEWHTFVHGPLQRYHVQLCRARNKERRQARKAFINSETKARSAKTRAGLIARVCAIIGDEPMEFLNLANAWTENANNDSILTNDTKVVLTGITDLYTKWFASQTQIHKKLNIEKDEIFTYSTTDAPPDLQWLAHAFPDPSQVFHEISELISLEEFNTYIQGKGDNASPGLSKLRIGILKHLDTEGCKAVLTLINSCIKTCTVPEQWKKILLIPLPKKHFITSLMETRPIALLETMLKILTGIINQRLLACWTKHRTLHKSQYAFLPGSGSADPAHIARCVYEISNERIQNEVPETQDQSKYVHVAYLDQAKAYDAAEHSALTMSLRSLGVPTQTLRLLASIDEGCSLQLKTHDGLTPEIPIGRGARQGDPLSPLRYNAFMNGLLRHLDTAGVAWSISNNIKLHAQFFADDAWLCGASREDLQKLLHHAHEFFEFFKLKCNTAKSFYTTNDPNNQGDVHFRGANNTAPAPLTKKSKTDHIRYLGYFFNLDLDWTHQADMITSKLRETLCTIQSTTFTSFDTISALNAVIAGKLNYLLQIITPSPTQLNTWDTLIKDISRSKVRLGRSQPTLQITTAKQSGGLGLTLPSELYHAVLINETHMRLAGDGLGAHLTWHRLEEYSTHRHFGSCALKFPRAHKYSRQYRTNHFQAVSQALHNLGWSMDTDRIRPPQTDRANKDKELITSLEAAHQDMFGRVLRRQGMRYLS